LNGKIPILEEKHKWPGPDCLRNLKNSPTLFGEALVVDLSTFPEENPSCTLLQYVDDLLLTNHDREKRWEATKALVRPTL
jgi:hypothetical protein